MSFSLNQYAQKIAQEHPTAIWSLDDEAYYVQLMSDSGTDIANWQNMNVASITNITPPANISLPNPSRPCTRIIGQEIGGALYGSAFVKSNSTFSTTSGTFTISYNLYSYDTDIRYTNVGYQMGDSVFISAVFGKSGDNTQVTYETSSAHGFSNGDYVTVTGTVPTSGNEGAYDQDGTVEVVSSTRFRINSSLRYRSILAPNEPGGEAFEGEMKEASDAWLSGLSDEWHFLSATFNRVVTNAKIRLKIWYNGDFEKTFLINNLTVGQDSAEFAQISTGQIPVTLPSNIATTETQGIPALNYNSTDNFGYYIVKNNILCSKNSGIPIIYGSSNKTILYSNSNGPSLILPGFGFLNEYGIKKSYNLETFIRFNGKTSTLKRIIGPLQSSDGLYVNGSFMTLKIGSLYKTAMVSQWDSPMLLNIQYNPSEFSLWINGDKIISISIENESIVFPENTASSGAFLGKNQDWIGFYSYSDLNSIEIDCIAIYPYNSDELLLKRRFLYGQAVKTEAAENFALQNGGEFYHFQYPSIGNTKNYNFPTFAKWNICRINDNLIINNNNVLTPLYNLPSIYLGSVTTENWLSDQYAVQNEGTKFIKLKPDADYDTVYGYLYFDNLNMIKDALSSFYMVIKKLASSASEQRIATFFDDTSKNYFKISLTGSELSYKLYYNGTESTIYTTSTSTINTKISVGIDIDAFKNSSDYNLSSFFKNSGLKLYVGGMPNTETTFDGNIYKIGFCSSRAASEISSNFTNGIVNTAASLETNVASYTLLAKEIFNSLILDIATKSYWESSVPLSFLSIYDNDAFDLDLIQLNIDYPATLLQNNGNMNTSSEYVRSYLSFQDNKTGLNKTTFASTQSLPTSKIVDAKTSWEDKKYEFIDYTIVYPPTNISIEDYSLVIHLDIVSSVFESPIKIKYLEIFGKTLNENSSAKISSISSNSLEYYSLTDNGLIDYKNNTNVFIHKNSGSYLSLGNNSGIGVSSI